MSCSLCSENGGHFKPKYGGHFDRFFHTIPVTIITYTFHSFFCKFSKVINKIGFKPVEQDDEYNEKLKNLESFLFDNFNLSQYQDENEDSSYFFFDADFWMNIKANHDISFKLEYSKNRSSTTNYKDIFSVIKDDKVIYFGFISQYNPNIGLIESSEIMLFEEVVFTDTIYI